MIYGLQDLQFEKIITILSNYSDITEAILFGSRALNNYNDGSDIDIALKISKESKRIIYKIKEDLDDSNLPFFFDLVDYFSINNEKLKRYIDQEGITIYKIPN